MVNSPFDFSPGSPSYEINEDLEMIDINSGTLLLLICFPFCKKLFVCSLVLLDPNQDNLVEVLEAITADRGSVETVLQGLRTRNINTVADIKSLTLMEVSFYKRKKKKIKEKKKKVTDNSAAYKYHCKCASINSSTNCAPSITCVYFIIII